jgi:hypothetical protein
MTPLEALPLLASRGGCIYKSIRFDLVLDTNRIWFNVIKKSLI